MEKCLMCEKGHLKKIMNREVIYGVYLGDFPAKKCSFCNEIWTDGETMEKIEKVAKEKGVWGLGVKTKITKAGNSLCVRIPNKIANFLNLKSGEEAYIHPEENKLVIEYLNKLKNTKKQ